MQSTRRPYSLTGIILLLLGIGFLLNSLNLWNFGRLFSDWWPLLIIFVGLSQLFSSSQNKIGGLIILVAGAILQLLQLNLVTASIWSLFWPAVLIIIGLSLLINRSEKSLMSSQKSLNEFVVFGGVKRNLDSLDFEGGSVTVWFGGAEIDLRKAKLAPNATLHIFAAFGGVDIRVPENYLVKIVGSPIFGGWEDKTIKPESDKGTQQLTIHSTILFGGMTVRN